MAYYQRRGYSPLPWEDRYNFIRERPRSHSPTPTPQPPYRYRSPEKPHRSRSPVNEVRRKSRWSPTDERFSTSSYRKFNYHRDRRWNDQKPNNVKRPIPKFGYSANYQPLGERSERPTQRLPQSQYKAPELKTSPVQDVPRPVSSKNAYLREAQEAYESDRQTIKEVTQLLVNEDKEMEGRLVKAMENILERLKKSHNKHVDLVSSITNTT